MPPEAGHYNNGELFEPTKATLCAWDAQAHMLEYANSEPGSAQADIAIEQANREFGEMVSLTWDYLRNSAFKRSGGSPDEVEEILQETYIRAYRYLPKFHGNSNVETWLTQTMFNRLSTYYKKKSRDDSFQVDQPYDGYDLLGEIAMDSSLQPENQVEQGEELEDIMELLSVLSPRRRKAVVLAHYYSYSHEEIARILGITVATSKVWVHRARKTLQERKAAQDPPTQE